MTTLIVAAVPLPFDEGIWVRAFLIVGTRQAKSLTDATKPVAAVSLPWQHLIVGARQEKILS
ncbi:hypothetical protein [Microseira wollei]|uniref:hypothetical protein n=1 Tax=Microseira wollei TaxID=467598 RepID=UPI001CFEB185|nr:hypothetical protein [Microseira wollei]